MVFEQINLGQQAAHFQLRRIGQEAHADGLPGDRLHCFGFRAAEAVATGSLHEVGQFTQIEGCEFLCRGGLGQELARTAQKHAGKQGFILGEDAIEDAQEFAFTVANLIREVIPKARHVFQLQKHRGVGLGGFGLAEAYNSAIQPASVRSAFEHLRRPLLRKAWTCKALSMTTG